LTPEQERWAEALAIERLHGEGAPRWIAERIGTLALAGDDAGVERFREIAARLDQLRAGREQ
jgi:protein-disulfide isomerase-like protein with CxxC motif